jgi:predicted Zn-dependent protease with MMP-like domain
MGQVLFERFISEAVQDLPADFRSKLDNIEITVEEWPDARTLRLTGIRDPRELLGYYRGVPRSRRTHRYGLVLPDQIILYRRPIEMRCHTVDELRSSIYHVLYHEIAHHFGISDDRLREIGAY